MSQFISPSRAPKSIEEILAGRVQSLERRLAAIERNGATRARNGAIKHIEELTGDGAETEFIIFHPLASRDLISIVYAADSPYARQAVTTYHDDEDSIRIVFGAAPADGDVYKVVIIG